MTSIKATSGYPTLQGVDVQGKRVLLRVDYNIEIRSDGRLVDDWRVRATLPTIQRLIKAGARVGILTHCGRPMGRVVPELSTAPLAEHLSKLLGKKVEFVPDCVGRVAEHAMAKLEPGHVILFENTRFHLGEQMNQQPFVEKLAALGDIFVNDAFASAHRPHASTSGLAATMEVSLLGDLMLRELEWVERVTTQAKRPLLLMVGGSDVGPRLEIVSRLLTHADTLVLGGGVGMTTLAARDLNMGQSLIDHACIEQARNLLSEAGVVGCRLHLPKDFVVAAKNNLSQIDGVKDMSEIGDDDVASDLGPRTVEMWSRLIDDASTVVWMGSMGAFDHEAFRKGARTLAKRLVTHKGFSLVAGAGLVMTLAHEGLRDQLPAVSTGVAALLYALSGQTLPCLHVLGNVEQVWNGMERRLQPRTNA